MADAPRSRGQRLKHLRPHAAAHPRCDWTSWSACDKAWAERLGRCHGLTADKKAPQPCKRWATEEVADLPFCDQHAEAARQSLRRAIEKAGLDDRIDSFIARTAQSPSVWS